MKTYSEDIGDIKVVVEFEHLESPVTAWGNIYVVPLNPQLAKMVGEFAKREKITFEYANSQLNVYVDDRWQTQEWCFPVLKHLAQLAARAMLSVNLVPKRTDI